MQHAAAGAQGMGPSTMGIVANSVEGGNGQAGDDANVPRGWSWTVQNNVLRYSHGGGISLGGSSWPTCTIPLGQNLVVQGNTVTDCGDEGIEGACTLGLMVSNNTLANNGGTLIGGVIDPGFDPGWQAGGAKWALQQGMVVSGNTVQGNAGPGLWCDVTCLDTTYSGNTVSGNASVGIMYEISDTAQIFDNVVYGNGPSSSCCGSACPAGSGCSFYSGAQILVSASPNVQVYSNTVSGAMGIGLLQQYRDSPCGSDCPSFDPSCCMLGPSRLSTRPLPRPARRRRSSTTTSR